MARETWAGKVVNLVATTQNAKADWVIVKLSNTNRKAPRWYALELTRRTPTALAQLNLLRDAQGSGKSVRLLVDRDKRRRFWREALILAVEYPRLIGATNTKAFND